MDGNFPLFCRRFDSVRIDKFAQTVDICDVRVPEGDPVGPIGPFNTILDILDECGPVYGFWKLIFKL